MIQDDVIPDDEPLRLLDAHQPSATVDKPFKKGKLSLVAFATLACGYAWINIGPVLVMFC